MVNGELRRPKISFDGPAEPRIVNATPESCLVEQLNIEPTKWKLTRKAMHKKTRARVNSARKNQSVGQVAEPLTCVGAAVAVPASEEKVSVTTVALLNRIGEEAEKVQALEAELDEEKRKLSGDLEVLKKEIADQEREWTQCFEAIRKEIARLTLT